jgi:FdhD protein
MTTLTLRAGSAERRRDDVVREEPLEIRVQGESLAVVMRTPGRDKELTAGFLLSEGVIRGPKDIALMTRCEEGPRGSEENVLNVLLAKGVAFDPQRLLRHVITSSGCGICGRSSLEALRSLVPPVQSKLRVSRKLLWSLPGLLKASQKSFKKTGGLHASALFDPQGEMLVLREDVGRHNALDKVIGFGLLKGLLPMDESILLLSGRVSFELMQKALSAGIPLVAAIGAPSSLAVDLAKKNGQTLVGFLREGQMNVYSHPKAVI